MDQYSPSDHPFLALYEEFAQAIFRHCYFRVSSRELAEDLTQESFMRVWNYLAAGKTIDNPKAFLYRIAGNLIIDYYRSKKDVSLDALTEDGFDPIGQDENSILAYAASHQVLALMQQLDPASREILTLRYVDNLSIKEIAEVIGQSENVASVRIHRATEKLKKIFQYGKPT